MEVPFFAVRDGRSFIANIAIKLIESVGRIKKDTRGIGVV